MATAIVLTACGDSEPRGQDALRALLGGIDTAAGMVELDHLYEATCSTGCPRLVIWYRVDRSPQDLGAALAGALSGGGWEMRGGEGGTTPFFAAAKDDYILYVTLDAAMIDRNPYAPAGANAEVVVKAWEAPAG